MCHWLGEGVVGGMHRGLDLGHVAGFDDKVIIVKGASFGSTPSIGSVESSVIDFVGESALCGDVVVMDAW
jgi:hypothetical protein